MSEQQKIQERNESYARYVNAISPKTAMFWSLLRSFLIGGLTCAIGQAIFDIFTATLKGQTPENIAGYTSMVLVATAILMTGIGFYDVISRVGGAGSFLPITGFANAMSASSLEFKTEGLVFGTSVKMFTLVGPVIVNGVVWSAVAGVVRYLVAIIFKV